MSAKLFRGLRFIHNRYTNLYEKTLMVVAAIDSQGAEKLFRNFGEVLEESSFFVETDHDADRAISMFDKNTNFSPMTYENFMNWEEAVCSPNQSMGTIEVYRVVNG